MKSVAMGIIPFTINDDLRLQLRALGENGGEVNWVEMVCTSTRLFLILVLRFVSAFCIFCFLLLYVSKVSSGGCVGSGVCVT